MAFRNIKEVSQAYEDGRLHQSFIYKSSTPSAGSANRWTDMSMGAGTPVYNAYVGGQLEATQLIGSRNRGINTGPNMAAGQQKYLSQFSLASPQTTNGPPLAYVIADYLMFYPLIDGDATEQQDMTNDVTLPRYSDGVGVKAFIVITTPMTSNGNILIGYTDSDGVDRTYTQSTVFAAAVGVSISCGPTSSISQLPFVTIPEKGIKRINYVTNLTSLGGFYCICLCKPIASMMQQEPLTITEKSLVTSQMSMPRIYDGAYLNALIASSSTGAPGSIRGQFDFIWSN